MSTYHLLVHFPTKNKIKELQGDQQLARHYFTVSIDNKKSEEGLPIDKLDQWDMEEKGELVEQLVSVPFNESDLMKIIQIGLLLPESIRMSMLDLLRRNVHIFA